MLVGAGMGRHLRTAAISFLLVATAFVTTSTAHTSEAVPACPALAEVEHLGLACRGPDGLIRLFAADGSFAGTTHGVDELAGDGDPMTVGAAIPPSCIIAPTASDHYAKVIYTRPTDVPDAYATKAATIIATVHNANGLLHDAAVATGGVADIKVECDASGNVKVYNTVLAHDRATSGSFANVMGDLKAAGHDNPRVKHWVFVDGGSSNICGCGVGHVYPDDSAAITNANNGETGFAMYAVTWVMTSTRVALHELSHNMGAVQDSAPHTSSAGHCRDGLDTMCYQDGGATQCTSGFSCPGTCAVEVYDCGKDDYFHRNPASGSYLATHWNVGSTLNRFLAFGIPQMVSLSCTSPIGVTQASTCTMRATDDATLRYTVSWGDATSTCVPSCSGYVAQNVAQTASHTWATGGAKLVSVRATDSQTPAQTSLPMNASVLVDAAAPSTSLAVLTPLAPDADATASPLWYNADFRFSLGATDTGGTGVAGSYYRLDGGAIARYTAPVTVAAAGVHALAYNSTDAGANAEAPKAAAFGVDKTLPTVAAPTVSCDPCISSVLVAGAAADTTSRLHRLSIDWSAPLESGPLAGNICAATVTGQTSGTTSCTFTGVSGLLPGQYCFRTRAIDRAGNVARSDPVCALVI